MKITKVTEEDGIFTVSFTPNCIESIFGIKDKTRRFRETWNTYRFGGGTVYINEKGEKLDNGDYIGEYLDNWKRKF